MVERGKRLSHVLRTIAWGVMATVAVWAPQRPLAAAGDADVQPGPSEYQVKAAFLFNFVKYVEWPAEVLPENGTLVIGVLGESPIKAPMTSVEGKQAMGRTVIVKYFDDLPGLEFCHILFLSGSEAKKLGATLKAVSGQSSLTVGESDRFLANGGMINFVIVDGKIGLDVNVGAAERANLKISSKLLRLARNVVDARSRKGS